jgi:hypothetical protein
MTMLREGIVEKQQSHLHSWKKRYLYLTDTELIIRTKEGGESDSHEHRHAITEVSAELSPPAPAVNAEKLSKKQRKKQKKLEEEARKFTVTNNDKSGHPHAFRAPSRSDAEQWVEAISNARAVAETRGESEPASGGVSVAPSTTGPSKNIETNQVVRMTSLADAASTAPSAAASSTDSPRARPLEGSPPADAEASSPIERPDPVEVTSLTADAASSSLTAASPRRYGLAYHAVNRASQPYVPSPLLGSRKTFAPARGSTAVTALAVASPAARPREHHLKRRNAGNASGSPNTPTEHARNEPVMSVETDWPSQGDAMGAGLASASPIATGPGANRPIVEVLEVELTAVSRHLRAAKSPDEIDIEPGDLLTVFECGQDGWWTARSQRTGEMGLVPGNHVEVIDGDFVHEEDRSGPPPAPAGAVGRTSPGGAQAPHGHVDQAPPVSLDDSTPDWILERRRMLRTSKVLGTVNGWTQFKDFSSGRRFWSNKSTGEFSWRQPVEPSLGAFPVGDLPCPALAVESRPMACPPFLFADPDDRSATRSSGRVSAGRSRRLAGPRRAEGAGGEDVAVEDQPFACDESRISVANHDVSAMNVAPRGGDAETRRGPARAMRQRRQRSGGSFPSGQREADTEGLLPELQRPYVPPGSSPFLAGLLTQGLDAVRGYAADGSSFEEDLEHARERTAARLRERKVEQVRSPKGRQHRTAQVTARPAAQRRVFKGTARPPVAEYSISLVDDS